MDTQSSLVFKLKSFPEIAQQELFWNNHFPGIGNVDPEAMLQPVPDLTIRVCFPRFSFLAEGGPYIYAIQRIREVLKSCCVKHNLNFWDDCDFFHPEILIKEEEKIRLFEESCQQQSNLIVASVQFWILHQKSIQLEDLLATETRMSVSHATELLCAQGNPGNLWEGTNQNHWFSCPGSPTTIYGIPCFDRFRGDICLTSFNGMNRPETEGGAASLFIK